METFRQILAGPVWDGDLVSKTERDRLKEAGFIDSGYGFNFIAAKGVEAAVALGLLKRGSTPTIVDIANAIVKAKTCRTPGCTNYTGLDEHGYCRFHANARGTAADSPTGE